MRCCLASVVRGARFAERPAASPAAAFSLVEVVVVIGIFAVAILALLGFFLPTLRNMAVVSETDRAIAAGERVAEFLQTRDFPLIYRWTAEGRQKRLLSYEVETGSDRHQVRGKVVEWGDSAVEADFGALSGTPFLVTVSASSLNRDPGEEGRAPDVLPGTMAGYRKGYLALKVRIYTLPNPQPGQSLADISSGVGEEALILTFDTAVNR